MVTVRSDKDSGRNKRVRGVFLDTDTVDGNDLDLSPIQTIDNVQWSFHGVSRGDELPDRIADCAIIICNKVVLDRKILRRAPVLRLIVVAATGTNNIDLKAAAELGVVVCNVRGYGTPSVVQHVYALILALTTQLPRYMESVAKGAWQKHPHFCFFDFPIRELQGCTMGIVVRSSMPCAQEFWVEREWMC